MVPEERRKGTRYVHTKCVYVSVCVRARMCVYVSVCMSKSVYVCACVWTLLGRNVVKRPESCHRWYVCSVSKVVEGQSRTCNTVSARNRKVGL